MRRKLILLIACACFLAVLPGATCLQQAVPVLTKIVSVLTKARVEADRVDAIVQEYFRKTNAPDEQRARYATIRDNVLRGISFANSALQGTTDLSQEQYDAAIAEYAKAWSELMAFLQDTGALNASGIRGPSGAPVTIKPPDALTFKVDGGDDG